MTLFFNRKGIAFVRKTTDCLGLGSGAFRKRVSKRQRFKKYC